MRNGLVTLVLVVGTAALLYLFLFQDNDPEPIPYSGSETAFLTMVANGEVASVHTRGEALEIKATYIDENTEEAAVFESWIPAQFTTNVQADINATCDASEACTSVEFSGEQAEDGNAFFTLLLSMLFPILLIGVFLWFMFRQAQGSNNQSLSFGRSRARMFVGN